MFEAGLDPAAQLELQRQLQDERRNEIHAKYATAITNMVQTEAGICAVNRAKIQSTWRDRLRAVKKTELVKQIESLIQDFDHQVDRKDAFIALLSRYVSIAEEQRRRCIRTHLSTMDGILALLQERSTLFEESLEDNITRLQAQFDQEIAALKKSYDARERLLQEIKSSTQEQEDQLIQQLNSSYSSKISELKNQSQETCNVLRLNLEEINADLERHLLDAHEKYRANTDTKQHQFKVLLLKDQQSSLAIEKQKQKIERLSKAIAHWRAKIQTTTEEFRAKNALLKKEKEATYLEFVDLKKKLTAYRNSETGRMKALVLAAHEAEDRIISLKESANKIIRVSTLCTRLETEAERVNEVDRIDDETNRHINDECKHDEMVATSYMNVSDNFLGKDAMMAVSELRLIYKKLSRVSIDRLALERESVLLERENRELREALQRFLSTSGMGAKK